MSEDNNDMNLFPSDEDSSKVAETQTPVTEKTETVEPVSSVSPENLPRIDAVLTKPDEPKVSPENLPLKATPVVTEDTDDTGFLPGLDSEEDKGNRGGDVPPEFQTRNNPVFIDAVPPKVEKRDESPEKEQPPVEIAPPAVKPAAKPPLVFTEEKPVPTRNGETVPNFREQQRRRVDEVRKKQFNPIVMQNIREDDTIGVIMVKARQASGYTYEEVRLLTHITENFVVAIEQDNISKIPSVYYASYLKTLCNTYRLSAEVCNHVMELNQNTFVEREETPLEIMQEINSKTRVNEEEERRLNRIFTIFLVVIGIFVILGLWLIVWLVIQHNVKKSIEQDNIRIEQPVSPVETKTPVTSTSKLEFDQDNFRPLMPNPGYEMNELEVSPTPAVHKK